MLRVRIACGLAAVACAAAAWEILRQGLATRPLGLAAVIGTALLACVLAAAVCAPGRLLAGAGGRLAELRSRLSAQDIAIPSAASLLLFGCALAAFGLLIARFLLLENNPFDDDQAAFLETAQAVADDGGPARLLADLYAGRFEEANRHPLYIAFLSMSPSFAAGQVLSAALAAITLLVTSTLCLWRFGPATAGCYAVLLATNAAFYRFGTSVVCEILVVLLSGVIWFVWSQPDEVETSRHDQALSDVRVAARGAALGALLGLLWLTKATGLLLTAIAAAWLAWRLVRERFSRQWLLAGACFGLAWCLVASPLLVRNVRRFGNPFYNVNSKLLFADEYSDAVLESPLPTSVLAAEYWRTHSVTDMILREVRGLVWESYILLRSLGPPPLDDGRVLIGIGLGLMLAAGVASGRAASRGGRVALAWTAVFLPVFAWYVPVAAGERFLMPLLVPLLVLAARGIVAVAANALGRDRSGFWLASAAIAWCTVWTAATWLWAEPV